MVKNPPANAGNISDMGLIPGSGRSPGEGHGNPLWYSCLEKLMDRVAWWATVHKVAQSQIGLKLFSMHTLFSLCKQPCKVSVFPIYRWGSWIWLNLGFPELSSNNTELPVKFKFQTGKFHATFWILKLKQCCLAEVSGLVNDCELPKEILSSTNTNMKDLYSIHYIYLLHFLH